MEAFGRAWGRLAVRCYVAGGEADHGRERTKEGIDSYMLNMTLLPTLNQSLFLMIRFVSTTEVSVIVSAMQRVLHDTVKAHVLEHRNCRFKVGCIEEVLYTSPLMTREMLVNQAFRCSIPHRSFEELTKLAVKEMLP
jgi:hypothetical protein